MFSYNWQPHLPLLYTHLYFCNTKILLRERLNWWWCQKFLCKSGRWNAMNRKQGGCNLCNDKTNMDINLKKQDSSELGLQHRPHCGFSCTTSFMIHYCITYRLLGSHKTGKKFKKHELSVQISLIYIVLCLYDSITVYILKNKPSNLDSRSPRGYWITWVVGAKG